MCKKLLAVCITAIFAFYSIHPIITINAIATAEKQLDKKIKFAEEIKMNQHQYEMPITGEISYMSADGNWSPMNENKKCDTFDVDMVLTVDISEEGDVVFCVYSLKDIHFDTNKRLQMGTQHFNIHFDVPECINFCQEGGIYNGVKCNEKDLYYIGMYHYTHSSGNYEDVSFAWFPNTSSCRSIDFTKGLIGEYAFFVFNNESNFEASGIASVSIDDVIISREIGSDSETVVYHQGDVNGDGSFSLSDVVLLQKWLLANIKELPCWQAADLCKDNRLDVFDLCLMKRKLIETEREIS